MDGVFRGKRVESLGARGWTLLGQEGGVFRGKGWSL